MDGSVIIWQRGELVGRDKHNLQRIQFAPAQLSCTQLRVQFKRCVMIVHKWFIPLLVMMTMVSCDDTKCPSYCQCYKSRNNHGETRYVECIGKGLVNIDLDVPLNVQFLNISYNFISILDDHEFQLHGLVNLVELNLKHNAIRYIGLHAFAGLRHLHTVDLSENHLRHVLPWTFQTNLVLSHLSLASNPIGKFTKGPIFDIPKLTVLDLAGCRLGFIHHEVFAKLPQVTSLDLADNQLIGIDVAVLEPLRSLKELDLNRNPLSCDANMDNLTKWLENNLIRVNGSPCRRAETKEGDVLQVSSTKKLEKIIALLPPSNSGEEGMEMEEYQESEREEGCVCIEEPLDVGNDMSTTDDMGHKHFMPLSLAFAIGFQLGIVMTVFSVYIWSNNGEQTRPNPSSQSCQSILAVSELYESCPETPPPTYGEIFRFPQP